MLDADEARYHVYGIGNNGKGQIGHCSVLPREAHFRHVFLPQNETLKLHSNACGMFSCMLANRNKLLVAGDNVKVKTIFHF